MLFEKSHQIVKSYAKINLSLKVLNKREDGSSDLYSLFDYKDFRDTMDLEKAYLQGRFDAVPYIDDSELNLKSLIENE